MIHLPRVGKLLVRLGCALTCHDLVHPTFTVGVWTCRCGRNLHSMLTALREAS